MIVRNTEIYLPLLWFLNTEMVQPKDKDLVILHGLLARYVKLRVAHAPGMPGTSSPPPRVSDPDMHHGTCVTHVPWCIPGSLTSGFLWNRWRGKRSQHSRHMRNPQFYVSGKRTIVNTMITDVVIQGARAWINIKILSFQYRNSHCGDKKSYDHIFSTIGISLISIPVRWWLSIDSGPQ